MSLRDYKGRYLYVKKKSMNVRYEDRATVEEAERLYNMADLIRWKHDQSAMLYAGWLMISPICGALRWRSNIYIQGQESSGKTWVFENITQKYLGNVALYSSSKTTEPGLRQAISNDAIPVIFDEAEAEKTEDAARIQNVLRS